MYKNLLNYFDATAYLNDLRSWTAFTNWSPFTYSSRLSTASPLVRILLESVLIGDTWPFSTSSRAWETSSLTDDTCRDMSAICGAGTKHCLLHWYREHAITNTVHREIYALIIFSPLLPSFLSRGISKSYIISLFKQNFFWVNSRQSETFHKQRQTEITRGEITLYSVPYHSIHFTCTVCIDLLVENGGQIYSD